MTPPPRWALSAKAAMDRLRTLSYWWYDRQDIDTGIGFDDDDVESVLLSAPTLVLGQDDSRARKAFRIVAEQMWRQWGMDGDKEVGYPTNVETGDIEHAAEPISFSQPNAAAVDPGNPIYIERCLISMQNLDYWTGINEKGHRHFKAFYFGAGGVKDDKYYDCDIPMNARAVIPGVYAAWHNHDPELMRYLREYANAWVEHALDTSMSKPYGVVPSEIRFGDDKVGGYSGRWDQIAGYRQFDWSSYHRSAYNMYYFFISMYLLTADEKYLEPVRETVEYLAANYGVEDASDYAAMYRSFTRKTDLDYLFTEFAKESPVWRWFLERDPDALADWCDAMVQDLDATMDDRTVNLDLRDACANYDTCVDDSVLRLMYTGGLGHQVSAYPFVRVSWSGVNENFAALVVDEERDGIEVLVYSFEDGPRDVEMVVWDLTPGEYTLTDTPETDGVPLHSRTMHVERWGRAPVRLLPRAVQRIRVRPLNLEPLVDLLPDPAVSADDVLSDHSPVRPGETVRISVPVHNIGSREARDVEMEVRELPSGTIVWRAAIEELEAPRRLRPSSTQVSFPWKVGDDAEGLQISLSIAGGGQEITLANNRVQIPLQDLRTERWTPRVRLYGDPPPPEQPFEVIAVRRHTAPDNEWSTRDPEWDRAPAAVLAHRMYSDGGMVSNRTEVRVSYDDENLYIYYCCNDSDPQTLVARLTERDCRVWDDESIEITIDPRHDHRFFYHFAVNPIGTTYDAEMVSPYWDGNWTVRTPRGNGGWEALVTMPFRTIGIRPNSGDTIGINFIRTNYADEDRGDRQTSIWQPIPGWTLRPAYFGHLRFE